eukprot:9473787-Pyramimonas_sp.AAC.1
MAFAKKKVDERKQWLRAFTPVYAPPTWNRSNSNSNELRFAFEFALRASSPCMRISNNAVRTRHLRTRCTCMTRRQGRGDTGVVLSMVLVFAAGGLESILPNSWVGETTITF